MMHTMGIKAHDNFTTHCFQADLLLRLTVALYDFTLFNPYVFVSHIQLLTRVQVDCVKLPYAYELFFQLYVRSSLTLNIVQVR